MEQVILVDELDNEVGFMDKMEAHRTGTLHRAFSVILFNSKGEMLLQKRSKNKYHSAGLWTNACCSHPKPWERIEEAVTRRLQEEMGITIQPTFAYKFIYKITFDNQLIEHELDYVYLGLYDDEPVINGDEVEHWRFASIKEIRKDIDLNPEAYAHWFKLIMNHPQLETLLPPLIL